ncbi:hypothetical protein [Longispora urticae]
MKPIVVLACCGVGVLVLVGVIVAVVFLAQASAKAERARRESLRQWAVGNGWTFALAPATDWTPRLPGRNRRGVSLALFGRFGARPTAVGEYSYTETTGSGDNTSTTTHRYVVVTLMLDQEFPAVSVQRRGVVSQLGRQLFGDRGAATGHKQFDALFQVVAEDPGSALRLVGPALIHAHLAGAVPVWSLRGRELLMWEQGRIDLARVPGMAAPLAQVADLLGR